jgi:hypothetical protein
MPPHLISAFSTLPDPKFGPVVDFFNHLLDEGSRSSFETDDPNGQGD